MHCFIVFLRLSLCRMLWWYLAVIGSMMLSLITFVVLFLWISCNSTIFYWSYFMFLFQCYSLLLSVISCDRLGSYCAQPRWSWSCTMPKIYHGVCRQNYYLKCFQVKVLVLFLGDKIYCRFSQFSMVIVGGKVRGRFAQVHIVKVSSSYQRLQRQF